MKINLYSNFILSQLFEVLLYVKNIFCCIFCRFSLLFISSVHCVFVWKLQILPTCFYFHFLVFIFNLLRKAFLLDIFTYIVFEHFYAFTFYLDREEPKVVEGLSPRKACWCGIKGSTREDSRTGVAGAWTHVV